MILGKTIVCQPPSAGRPVQYVELMTRCGSGSVMLMLADTTTANRVLTDVLGYAGPRTGPTSLKELEESPGLWACTLPARAVDAANLNEILRRPLGLWYFRPNSRD